MFIPMKQRSDSISAGLAPYSVYPNNSILS
jgi:hypothetical protein